MATHSNTNELNVLGSLTCRLGGGWRGGVSDRVGQSGSPASKEASQDATFQRLQQCTLSSPGVAEQLQFDPWLRHLSGPQLLDVPALVIVLKRRYAI